MKKLIRDWKLKKEETEEEEISKLKFFLEDIKSEEKIYLAYEDENEETFYVCSINKNTGKMELIEGLPEDDGIILNKKGCIVLEK